MTIAKDDLPFIELHVMDCEKAAYNKGFGYMAA
jgi:hypothetical protein